MHPQFGGPPKVGSAGRDRERQSLQVIWLDTSVAFPGMFSIAKAQRAVQGVFEVKKISIP